MRTGGLLLTGGGSTRLGRDKATLVTPAGVSLASQVAAALAQVAAPVYELGAGVTGLPTIPDPERAGPLGAIAAAMNHLGSDVPAHMLVVAADLPLLRSSALLLLRDQPPADAVMPVIAGSAQVLCARYSLEVLARAGEAFAGGEQSLRRVLSEFETVLLDEEWWHAHGLARQVFDDVDTPEDLARFIDAGLISQD